MSARDEAGLVLVSLVLVVALLGLATGGSLWLTRAELWAAGRARAELQATYTAEAGLRHGLAVLAPDVDWRALLDLSPAALSAPDAPGPWPIGRGGWVAFPGPPFGYGLEVVEPSDSLADGDRVVVRSAATAVRDAVGVAIGSVSRAVTPYAPAPIVLAGGALEVEASALGTRARPRVEIRARDGSAALGAPSPSEMRAALDAVEAGGVLLDGDVDHAVRMFDLERFARRSGLVERPVTVLAAPLGSSGAAGVLRVRGGVAPALQGTGVVLVAGNLEVAGEVGFEGVLVVDGRLRIGGGPCRLDGLVWARGVAFSGPCRVTFEREAIAEADGALRLPRLPVLTGLDRG